MSDMTVTGAAAQLGISATRVRALIAAGELPARKFGDRWLLDSSDVDRAAQTPRVSGRPWSPRMAWAFIALAELRAPIDVEPPERSRLRRRLDGDPDLASVVNHARKRCTTHPLHIHPGLLGRAQDWPGAVRTGSSARGHAIVAVGRAEIYLSIEALDELQRSLRAARTTIADANLVVRIPQVLRWPFTPEIDAGPVSVAFDLWDAGDERSQEAAQHLFAQAMARYRGAHPR